MTKIINANVYSLEKLIENKDDTNLWKRYLEDNKAFINHLTGIFSRKDNVKDLIYLESLGMDLNSNGHPLLWSCVQNSKVRNTKHLLKHMVKDSPEAVFCNKVLIASALTDNEKNFVKRMKVLPLTLEKISLDKYSQIKEDISANVTSRDPTSRKKYLAEIDVIFLRMSLPNSAKTVTKKIKL